MPNNFRNIHVHSKGELNKSGLFFVLTPVNNLCLIQNCDKNLLYDLVLKLKPVLFLPGDYICRKVSSSWILS